MHKLIILALMATSIFGCQPQKTKLASIDKTKIAEEVRQVNNAIYKAGNDRKPRELYSHFSETITGVFDGSPLGSWEEHKKVGHAFFGAQKELKYTIDTIYSIDVISADVAVLSGSYSLSTTDTTTKSVTSSHAWTYVFNKVGNEWKVIHFHQSTKRK